MLKIILGTIGLIVLFPLWLAGFLIMLPISVTILIICIPVVLLRLLISIFTLDFYDFREWVGDIWDISTLFVRSLFEMAEEYINKVYY